MTSTELLQTLETYYDAAPRPVATAERCGPFTLFVKSDPDGWDFYARPRLALDVPFTGPDVEAVRDRQRELGVPQAIEWMHEITPSLVDAARADGMSVAQCPVLVLPAVAAGSDSGFKVQPPPSFEIPDNRVEVLSADSPRLADVVGAIEAGFQDEDEFVAADPGHRVDQMRKGLLVMVAAYDESGALVGGGSHSPRGTTTELTGIAVLPRARRRGLGAAITHALVNDAIDRGIETVFLSAQDDAVARVYERVGFVRVGTACVAKEPRA